MSSFVTWLLAVHVVLAALQGLPPGLPPALPLVAGFDWPRPDKRRNASGAFDAARRSVNPLSTNSHNASSAYPDPKPGDISEVTVHHPYPGPDEPHQQHQQHQR